MLAWSLFVVVTMMIACVVIKVKIVCLAIAVTMLFGQAKIMIGSMVERAVIGCGEIKVRIFSIFLPEMM